MVKTIEIFGKDQKEIEKRIQTIENGLIPIAIEDNQLAPQWTEKANLEKRMEFYNIPGLSIAFINNFEVEWTKTFGIRDARTKDIVTLDTLFESGSTAKSFTALAALQAVAKNLLDLDENVNNKLKTWKIPENDLTKEEKVTLKRLLSHTAGINRPDSMFGSEPGSTTTIDHILSGEKPALNDPVKVEFIPGSSHQYSNLGYIIIEKLLTDIYGKSFADLLKETILEPLSMKRSTFEYPEGELGKRTIVPHDQNGEAQETGIMRGAAAHGGLLTTPVELGKFVVELMKAYNGNSETISQETAKQMLTPVLPLDPAKFFGFTGQALGMFLLEKGNNLFFTHPGTNEPGAVCFMVGSPTAGQGLIIMSNAIKAELLHLEILYGVAKMFDWPFWQKD
ncbi:MAG: serine hydrolase domain-containing protein [Candidatus Heimdallarchaeota archaeon]